MLLVGGVTPELLLLSHTCGGGLGFIVGLGTTGLTGLGLLVKLLLQPTHLGLLTFYRRLKLEALVGYVLLYYCFFLPAFLCAFVPYVYLLITGSLLVFLALLLGAAVTLCQGAAVGTDLRIALVFSTAINLTILLLVLGLR